MFKSFENFITRKLLNLIFHYQGTIDKFNYPRKGKNIPPPRLEFDEQYEAQYGEEMAGQDGQGMHPEEQ